MLDKLDLLRLEWLSCLRVLKKGGSIGIDRHDICRDNHLTRVLRLSGPLGAIGGENPKSIHHDQVRLPEGINIRNALVEINLVQLLHVPDDPDQILHPKGKFGGEMLLGNGKIDEEIGFEHVPEDFSRLKLFRFWDLNL